jgi:hypothetical protein
VIAESYCAFHVVSVFPRRMRLSLAALLMTIGFRCLEELWRL